MEGLPAVETTEFITSKVIARALACFLGAKAVGVNPALGETTPSSLYCRGKECFVMCSMASRL